MYKLILLRDGLDYFSAAARSVLASSDVGIGRMMKAEIEMN